MMNTGWSNKNVPNFAQEFQKVFLGSKVRYILQVYYRIPFRACVMNLIVIGCPLAHGMHRWSKCTRRP